MISSTWIFTQTITDGSGQIWHQEEVRDFLPCYEDLLFDAVCAGQIANDGMLPPAVVEPVWAEDEAGRVAGITLHLPPRRRYYDKAIFADRVWDVLIGQGWLKEAQGEAKNFAWYVEAQPRTAERKRRFASALTRQPYPLVPRPLSDFGIAPPGDDEDDSEDDSAAVSLFIAATLLEELQAETAQSLEKERADFLAGQLLLTGEGKAALVLTSRVPARVEASASQAHFSFSPLTFEIAQQEIAARADGTTILGWHHNHPPPCARQCLQTIPPCKTETVFFSTADRSVHRASFPAPYLIALVSGKGAERRADQPTVRAYGWQDGVVKEREFSVF